MGVRRSLYCDNCESVDDVVPQRVTVNGEVLGAPDLCASCRATLVTEPLAPFRAAVAKLELPQQEAVTVDQPAPRDVRAYYRHIGEALKPREKLTAPLLERYRTAVKAGEWPPGK